MLENKVKKMGFEITSGWMNDDRIVIILGGLSL